MQQNCQRKFCLRDRNISLPMFLIVPYSPDVCKKGVLVHHFWHSDADNVLTIYRKGETMHRDWCGRSVLYHRSQSISFRLKAETSSRSSARFHCTKSSHTVRLNRSTQAFILGLLG